MRIPLIRYAEKIGRSKQAVYSKLKRGLLPSVVYDPAFKCWTIEENEPWVMHEGGRAKPNPVMYYIYNVDGELVEKVGNKPNSDPRFTSVAKPMIKKCCYCGLYSLKYYSKAKWTEESVNEDDYCISHGACPECYKKEMEK